MNETNDAADFEHPVEDFASSSPPFLSSPERHGFVTAWLIFMLIINAIVLLIYLYAANKPAGIPRISIATLYVLIILEIINIILIIRLLSWKKNSFYGFFVTTAIAFLINISNDIPIIACLLGLLGMPVLYGILQIKKNGVSAWTYLK